MLKVVKDRTDEQGDEFQLGLDDLAREGARRMLAAALEAETAAYIERLRGVRDEEGHAMIVRNGKARPRQVTVGSGTIEIGDDRDPGTESE